MSSLKTCVKKAAPSLFGKLHDARMLVYELIGRLSPRMLVRIWYRNLFGREIRLDDPQTLDEKVNWMKLNADISLWTRCADKIAVRDYVKEKGLGSTLNEVYGVYDDPCGIDFGKLPQEYVIKTSNGGGGRNIIIVDGTGEPDPSVIRRTAAGWLRRREGLRYYEPQYIPMKPRIIVERYLRPDPGESSLVDIKINCFDGKPHSVFLCSDRDPGRKVCYSVYDLEWNLHPDRIRAAYRTEKVYPRPKSFDRMLEYSARLSEGIPFVRVDWYEIAGEAVFSEMTFTPGGGFQAFYSDEFLSEMGSLIDLSKVERR